MIVKAMMPTTALPIAWLSTAAHGDGNSFNPSSTYIPMNNAPCTIVAITNNTNLGIASWLGLCPQHRGSAGKVRSRRVRRGMSRAGRALRMAVQGCHHAKHALGAFYRRIRARASGPPPA